MKRTDEGDDGRVHVSPRWNYCNFPRPGRWPRSMGQIFYFLASHSSRNCSFNLSSRKTQFCPHERHSNPPPPFVSPFSFSSFTEIFLREETHCGSTVFSPPPTRKIGDHPPCPIGKLLPSVEPITNRYYRFLENAPYLKISSPPFPVHQGEACPSSQITEPILLSRRLSPGRRKRAQRKESWNPSSLRGNEQQRSVKGKRGGGEMVNENRGRKRRGGCFRFDQKSYPSPAR